MGKCYASFGRYVQRCSHCGQTPRAVQAEALKSPSSARLCVTLPSSGNRTGSAPISPHPGPLLRERELLRVPARVMQRSLTRERNCLGCRGAVVSDRGTCRSFAREPAAPQKRRFAFAKHSPTFDRRTAVAAIYSRGDRSSFSSVSCSRLHERQVHLRVAGDVGGVDHRAAVGGVRRVWVRPLGAVGLVGSGFAHIRQRFRPLEPLG